GGPQIPTVVRMIEDEKPHLKDQVESMAKFVRKFSGGPDGSLLHDLVKFSGTQRFTREIHTAIFKAMADINFIQGSKYVSAMVKNKLPWEYTAASESAKTTTEHAVGFVDPRGQAIQESLKHHGFEVNAVIKKHKGSDDEFTIAKMTQDAVFLVKGSQVRKKYVPPYIQL
ncbi:unnamed protein product, partial [Prorocentrum cordatum]